MATASRRDVIKGAIPALAWIISGCCTVKERGIAPGGGLHLSGEMSWHNNCIKATLLNNSSKPLEIFIGEDAFILTIKYRDEIISLRQSPLGVPSADSSGGSHKIKSSDDLSTIGPDECRVVSLDVPSFVWPVSDRSIIDGTAGKAYDITRSVGRRAELLLSYYVGDSFYRDSTTADGVATHERIDVDCVRVKLGPYVIANVCLSER